MRTLAMALIHHLAVYYWVVDRDALVPSALDTQWNLEFDIFHHRIPGAFSWTMSEAYIVSLAPLVNERSWMLIAAPI